jgi:hypothetical protein
MEETEEGKKLSSKIQVPSQVSLFLCQILTGRGFVYKESLLYWLAIPCEKCACEYDVGWYQVG